MKSYFPSNIRAFWYAGSWTFRDQTENETGRALRLSSQSAMATYAMSTHNCQHRMRWRIISVLRRRDNFHECKTTEAFRRISKLRGSQQKCPNSLWNSTEKTTSTCQIQKCSACAPKANPRQSRRQHGLVAPADSIYARDVLIVQKMLIMKNNNSKITKTHENNEMQRKEEWREDARIICAAQIAQATGLSRLLAYSLRIWSSRTSTSLRSAMLTDPSVNASRSAARLQDW